MWRYLCLVGILLVAGCADNPPVPVVDRSAPAAVEAAAIPPAEPQGESDYIVQKGDTLYHIAQVHGVDYRNLAAWNNMTPTAPLAVGQPLRVTPPEGAVTAPVTGPGQIVVVEQTGGSAGNTAMLKHAPRGGTVAYSANALAEVRGMDSGAEAKPVETQPTQTPADKPVVAATSTGGIDWVWPANGKVLATFSEGGAGQASNKGIDIGGRMGEPIEAAAAGKVSFVGSLRGYGEFLVVHHGNDFISVYAHTSKILVKKDQQVAKGQKIAEIGKSDADQPKLHFEIRRQGKPVDPQTLLPARP